MTRKTVDLQSFMANQPIDRELFKYKSSLYPADKLGISERYGSVYTYILDWHKGKYSFLSEGLKSLMGYDDQFVAKGMEAFFQIIHPDDIRPFQRITSKWMEILLGKPEGEFNRYTANFNFRVKSNYGSYINLLQQPVYVSLDRKGNLIYETGILTDISRYRNDGNISLLLLDPDQKPLLEYYPKEDFMPKIGAVRQKMLHLKRLSLSTDNHWFRTVQKVVYDNIANEKLDVHLICRKLNISRSNFYKKLNKVSGLNPTQLIKTCRLMEALPLLSTPDYTVSEVAWKTGFKSHSYFSRNFRKLFGCTPSQYRRQVK